MPNNPKTRSSAPYDLWSQLSNRAVCMAVLTRDIKKRYCINMLGLCFHDHIALSPQRRIRFFMVSFDQKDDGFGIQMGQGTASNASCPNGNLDPLRVVVWATDWNQMEAPMWDISPLDETKVASSIKHLATILGHEMRSFAQGIKFLIFTGISMYFMVFLMFLFLGIELLMLTVAYLFSGFPSAHL